MNTIRNRANSKSTNFFVIEWWLWWQWLKQMLTRVKNSYPCSRECLSIRCWPCGLRFVFINFKFTLWIENTLKIWNIIFNQGVPRQSNDSTQSKTGLKNFSFIYLWKLYINTGWPTVCVIKGKLNPNSGVIPNVNHRILITLITGKCETPNGKCQEIRMLFGIFLF